MMLDGCRIPLRPAPFVRSQLVVMVLGRASTHADAEMSVFRDLPTIEGYCSPIRFVEGKRVSAKCDCNA